MVDYTEREERLRERKGKMFPHYITGPPQREKKFFFREILIIIIIFRRGVFTNFVIKQNYTLKI